MTVKFPKQEYDVVENFDFNIPKSNNYLYFIYFIIYYYNMFHFKIIQINENKENFAIQCKNQEAVYKVMKKMIIINIFTQ